MLAICQNGDEESITTSTVFNNDPIGAPQRPLGIGRDTVTTPERLPDRHALHAHAVLLPRTAQREVHRRGPQRVQHAQHYTTTNATAVTNALGVITTAADVCADSAVLEGRLLQIGIRADW